jgi:hypothetical protein
MKRIIPIVLVFICSSSFAEKFVGVELANYSSIRHMSYNSNYNTYKVTYLPGIVFESSDDKFRYKTSIRLERFDFGSENVSGFTDAPIIEGTYRGGEIQIGMYNRFKKRAIQPHFGLSLSGRSGRNDIEEYGGWHNRGEMKPFYSSQINLNVEGGLLFKFHERIRAALWGELQMGKQVQDYSHSDLQWYGPITGIVAFSLSTKIPFRNP